VKTILSIDGIDGSGKSTYARSLIAALEAAGLRSVLFRVDDFRQKVAWTTPEHEAEQYYDSYYDLARCDACLAAFVAGAPEVAIPVYDIVAERVTGERTLALADATVAIVEGVFPLRLSRAAAGVLVYLETSEPEARRRIVARDLAKGRSVDEINRRIDRRYFPSQRRYHRELDPRARAEIVIDNEAPTAPRVLKCDQTRVPVALRSVIPVPSVPPEAKPAR
jgi:uridine kinase